MDALLWLIILMRAHPHYPEDVAPGDNCDVPGAVSLVGNHEAVLKQLCEDLMATSVTQHDPTADRAGISFQHAAAISLFFARSI